MNTTANELGSKSHLLRVVAMIAFGLILVGGISACGSDDPVDPEKGMNANGTIVDDTIFDPDEFFDDPTPYVGEEVTITAKVNDLISQTSFTVSGGDVPDVLLVNAAEKAVEDVKPDSTVVITGIVHEFDVAETEKELDLDLNDDLYVDWEDEHSISATDIDVIDDPPGSGIGSPTDTD